MHLQVFIYSGMCAGEEIEDAPAWLARLVAHLDAPHRERMSARGRNAVNARWARQRAAEMAAAVEDEEEETEEEEESENSEEDMRVVEGAAGSSEDEVVKDAGSIRFEMVEENAAVSSRGAGAVGVEMEAVVVHVAAGAAGEGMQEAYLEAPAHNSAA
ncbi:hypothetical protein GX51_08330 [Blastomyces parvus]|uniref:Uncharacterized protein n=1 Tax=Blastomyces parvus TaxID=2060905 RepID=A0A2B7WEG1_9EURO|nr:hypothetical protein GX51_08330 [Blastomyces parvus]